MCERDRKTRPRFTRGRVRGFRVIKWILFSDYFQRKKGASNCFMTSENNFGGVASSKISVKYIGWFYDRDLRGESNKRVPSKRDENVI